MKYRLLFRLLVSGLVLGFVAGSSAAASRSTYIGIGAQVIKIGAVVSMSGEQASEGRLTREGYEFWRDWVNAHGGLSVDGKRYRIQIDFLDDASNPIITTQLAERLIDLEHVRYLLGPYGSSETMAEAAVAERKHIPLVVGSGSSEKIFNQGYRYTFGVMAPARKYLVGIIEFAVRQHPKPRTLAILAASDTFSLEAQQGAIASAHDHGIAVILGAVYPRGMTSFARLARQIADAQADIVLNAGHLDEAVALQRALAQTDYQAKIYGYAVGADTPDFVQRLGPLAEEAFSAAQWSASIHESGGPEFERNAAAYAKAFAHRYAHQADYHNAAASAAGLALELAIKNARSLDAQKVRRSLAMLNAPSFFGRLRFDGRGLNIHKTMVVNQIQDARLVTVYPLKAAVAKAIYPTRPWNAR